MATNDRPFSLGEFDTKSEGSVPPNPPSGPKPAAEETSQPVEAAPRTDGMFQETLCWLYGFAAGHADDSVRKSASRQIGVLEDYLIYRREEIAERRAELDPRVTWSADYQLAEKLGGQLETLRANLANMRKTITDLQDRRMALENLDGAISDLEAAIKTCNTLGLPF